jgi:precorrin-6Y C5,15-methyltransferase (decarboxylating)
MMALGGAWESIGEARAQSYAGDERADLLAVAIEAEGAGGLSRASGLADQLFAHDGQITKKPMRALALSALAPRRDERLWDIGAGSGSISVEWALAGGTAVAIEVREDRAVNIRKNAAAFGLSHRITIVNGEAPVALSGLEKPHAVFIGGGLDAEMFDALWPLLPEGARVVAHAVTLETEALLAELQLRHGGHLMRVEIFHAAPLGRLRTWDAVRPVVQWCLSKQSEGA